MICQLHRIPRRTRAAGVAGRAGAAAGPAEAADRIAWRVGCRCDGRLQEFASCRRWFRFAPSIPIHQDFPHRLGYLNEKCNLLLRCFSVNEVLEEKNVQNGSMKAEHAEPRGPAMLEQVKERRTECMRALAECGVAAQKALGTLASAFLERLVRAIELLFAQADSFSLWTM